LVPWLSYGVTLSFRSSLSCEIIKNLNFTCGSHGIIGSIISTRAVVDLSNPVYLTWSRYLVLIFLFVSCEIKNLNVYGLKFIKGPMILIEWVVDLSVCVIWCDCSLFRFDAFMPWNINLHVTQMMHFAIFKRYPSNLCGSELVCSDRRIYTTTSCKSARFFHGCVWSIFFLQ